MRLTKQGIRDLGGNQKVGPRKKHIHAFGAIVRVGARSDPYSFACEPIYGRKCIWCPHVKVI